jgi:hypothetical protein
VIAVFILNWLVFAFGKSQIQVPLKDCCLGYPTTVPVLAERHKAFRELHPLTATRAQNGFMLAVPIHFTLKQISWCPFIRGLGSVGRWGRY